MHSLLEPPFPKTGVYQAKESPLCSCSTSSSSSSSSSTSSFPSSTLHLHQIQISLITLREIPSLVLAPKLWNTFRDEATAYSSVALSLIGAVFVIRYVCQLLLLCSAYLPSQAKARPYLTNYYSRARTHMPHPFILARFDLHRVWSVGPGM
jgi:hypothetical protein